jgi:predicted Zn finger-like uncharacterized protein
MIVTCPTCKRKYRIDDTVIKAPYQKMRCASCNNIFVFENEAVKAPEPETPYFSPHERQEEIFGKRAKKQRSIGPIIFVILVVVLLGLSVGSYYYWVNYYGAGDRWLSIQKMEGQETVVKDGKVFFVRGTIVNGSTKARKYVIVKAKLFDDRGAVIGEHFGLAGLGLSREQIESMRRAEIENRVAEFRKSNVAAFVLQKKKDLPFVVVFPDSYAGKPKEFTVEIVESPSL